MEQTYYLIIIGALLVEYALSTISSVFNMKSITEKIPDGFQEYYDEEKYSSSQSYLRIRHVLDFFLGPLVYA